MTGMFVYMESLVLVLCLICEAFGYSLNNVHRQGATAGSYRCTHEGVPICATDYINEFLFQNQCRFEVHNFKLLITGRSPLFLSSTPPEKCGAKCNLDCTDINNPVCAVKKDSYRRQTFSSECELYRHTCLTNEPWIIIERMTCYSRPPFGSYNVQPYFSGAPGYYCPYDSRPVCATAFGYTRTFLDICQLERISIGPIKWIILRPGPCSTSSYYNNKKAPQYDTRVYIPPAASSPYKSTQYTPAPRFPGQYSSQYGYTPAVPKPVVLNRSPIYDSRPYNNIPQPAPRPQKAVITPYTPEIIPQNLHPQILRAYEGPTQSYDTRVYIPPAASSPYKSTQYTPAPRFPGQYSSQYGYTPAVPKPVVLNRPRIYDSRPYNNIPQPAPRPRNEVITPYTPQVIPQNLYPQILRTYQGPTQSYDTRVYIPPAASSPYKSTQYTPAPRFPGQYSSQYGYTPAVPKPVVLNRSPIYDSRPYNNISQPAPRPQKEVLTPYTPEVIPKNLHPQILRAYKGPTQSYDTRVYIPPAASSPYKSTQYTPAPRFPGQYSSQYGYTPAVPKPVVLNRSPIYDSRPYNNIPQPAPRPRNEVITPYTPQVIPQNLYPQILRAYEGPTQSYDTRVYIPPAASSPYKSTQYTPAPRFPGQYSSQYGYTPAVPEPVVLNRPRIYDSRPYNNIPQPAPRPRNEVITPYTPEVIPKNLYPQILRAYEGPTQSYDTRVYIPPAASSPYKSTQYTPAPIFPGQYSSQYGYTPAVPEPVVLSSSPIYDSRPYNNIPQPAVASNTAQQTPETSLPGTTDPLSTKTNGTLVSELPPKNLLRSLKS